MSNAFEAVCQVTSESGFCRAAPSGQLIQTPEIKLLNFGTYEQPFSADSLWNSRPRQVAFGDFVIPTSYYQPLVGGGDYSTRIFKANASDSPMVIYPPDGKKGVWNPDAEEHMPSITIPHWPADTVGAAGSDGHADIVDTETGIIHSLWQLRKVGEKWTCEQYAWSRIDGRGWGDGAHYFQGARAAGVNTMAGLIRRHEVNDGKDQYFHALAISLDFSGLSKTQQYVYPATAGDREFYKNFGGIPEGALLMLPPDFDETKIANPDLRKVVKTLKTFGGYVVDRNHGTPFYIYVENGVDYTLHPGGWNSKTGNDLQAIRAALRQVNYAKDWVNGYGMPIEKQKPMNMLSMRGPWKPVLTASGVVPRFNTHLQSAFFGPTDRQYTAENASGRSISNLAWMKPVPGMPYEFRVEATNGGMAYLRGWGGGSERFNTMKLINGESSIICWPDVAGLVPILGVISGIGDETVIRCTLKEF